MSLYDTPTFGRSTTPTPIDTGWARTLRKESNAIHLLQPQVPSHLTSQLTDRLPQRIPHPFLHLLLGTPNPGCSCSWNIRTRAKSWEGSGGWRSRATIGEVTRGTKGPLHPQMRRGWGILQ